ncbi:hypothetical protein C3747_7g140 [Trypanosoma cruzi]|uniref:Uncharacterized protein n=2 Tax=Trypanosoma cruzi TaxID=5693 RepID=Q4CX52_TRYCC|nr:hypothetical protein, conserved [Trypanosoma cruzi]EAN84849.1 hypothetical protein, conserved [Trypanosoma cruzi]KAF5222993.1 hypothetical protein ECC02_003820 [Trypanosoma cruzi]PWV20189.1 hypothetical protein C3747_7g140 [Trypanosoma cruzi]RNC60275.1 hypothetical protein TcCL_ESM02063 [Trypanosoma cruzi]|eukprot:XP_806700.1 hypothetical protein [Trypanosoma cruzi strain CL Brener]
MSAAFPTGVPNLFTTPLAAFPARNLFHSTERPVESGNAFTQEDRLMLQLLYQQQQAIQIQLQSMALSMQQLHLTLAGLSKVPAAMGAYGSTVNDTVPSSNPPNFVPMAAQSSFNDTADKTKASSREAVKGPRVSGEAVEIQSTNASRAKEASRSCTPPQEDLDVSRPSAVNRSMESAAPWDPSAGSRHSSALRMTRAENPLLSSLRGKLPTPNHSAAGSVSVGTGYSASANVSASLEESKPSVRPTIHPTSSSSLHADPDSRNVSASRRTVLAKRQQQQRVVLDNRKVEPPRRSHSGAETTTTGNKRKETFHDTKGSNSASDKKNRRVKEEYGDTSASAAGYDSQSEGYGSYETRQYLKSVGII